METPNKANEGPRITQAAIEDQIVSEHFFTAEEGVVGAGSHAPAALKLLTFCVLVMKNGYTVVGKAGVASPNNFVREIGEKFAREDAIRQVWPLLGYQLKTELHRIETLEDEALGEALTRMTAHRLGNSNVFRPEDAENILCHFTGKGTDDSEEGGKTFSDKLKSGPTATH
jgi:hypothetical protein